jgi:hypothetical protein
MDREDLLVLKEKPSFEGELSIRLTEARIGQPPKVFFTLSKESALERG